MARPQKTRLWDAEVMDDETAFLRNMAGQCCWFWPGCRHSMPWPAPMCSLATNRSHCGLLPTHGSSRSHLPPPHVVQKGYEHGWGVMIHGIPG